MNEHNENKLANLALALSFIGLISFLPLFVAFGLGLFLLRVYKPDQSIIRLKSGLSIFLSAVGIGLYSSFFMLHCSQIAETTVHSRLQVPKMVKNELQRIYAMQSLYRQKNGVWATSFDNLEYRPSNQVERYAICIPTDCLQLGESSVQVSRVLSAHLAVGDCLAAVISDEKQWILYQDGTISNNGPCIAND